MIKKIIVLLLLSGMAIAADDHYELMVSTTAYNRLVFPVPYSQIVLPTDAQLEEDPVSLQGNYGLLLKPMQGARPITVFVQLIDGRSFNVRLIPSSKPEGAVFRYAQALDMRVKPENEERPNDGWIADVFVSAFQNKTPSGFEKRTQKPLPIKAILKPSTPQRKLVNKQNQIDMIPISLYESGSYVINIYRLSAIFEVNIEPRDIYRKNVIAVAIDGDSVSQHINPIMVVLESKND